MDIETHDPKTARRALAVCGPFIGKLLELRQPQERQLFIVLSVLHSDEEPGGCRELASAAWGNPDRQAELRKIAKAKEALTARHNLPSALVRNIHPGLWLAGESRYWGNAIYGRLIVSPSSDDHEFDEMIANHVITAWWCLIRSRRQRLRSQLVAAT